MGEVWALRRGAPGYPKALLDLDAVAGQLSPAVLYGRGDRGLVCGLEPAHAVAIVGARRATGYGRAVAAELAGSLAAAGLVVVSGMAFGIDSAAHLGALDAGGHTVAVLACGADRVYPASAHAIYRRIVATGGAIVSEALPGHRPQKSDFPKRNRIMAALAAMTLVVEAREASGSRHTAERALEMNREVGAVPGAVDSPLSAGPHALIRDGAVLVRGAQDVLDEVLGVGAPAVKRVGAALDGRPRRLLESLGKAPTALAEVQAASGLDAPGVAVAMARLELLGYVREEAGRYSRTGLVPP